jgi:hypothetical protein
MTTPNAINAPRIDGIDTAGTIRSVPSTSLLRRRKR